MSHQTSEGIDWSRVVVVNRLGGSLRAVIHLDTGEIIETGIPYEVAVGRLQNQRAEADVGVQDQSRTRLLARMAGNIAAGLVSPKYFHNDRTSEDVAGAAIKIAEAILVKLKERHREEGT